MKKQLLFIALSFTLSVNSYAQQRGAKSHCITYNAMEQRFAIDPAAKIQFELAQKKLKTELNSNSTGSSNRSAATVYKVPVVFHILHKGGPENISDALCIAALNQVNSDYSRLGPDANSVAAPFLSSYINSDIKFMLAKKDPNGNCTNGIVHHFDTRTDWSSSNPSYYSGITWDPTKYLNVIIVNAIDGGGGLIGYTWLPGTWSAGDLSDAIVYDCHFLNGMNARDLSHEIGHWLNLPHTFGNTNDPGQTCGDDGIGDTPPTKGTFGCPSSLSGNVCNGGGTDNVENLMNYSACPKNFTTDQTNVMRTTLASNVSGRDNLSTPSNLTATGINNTVICVPVAEFVSLSNSYTVCSGSSLTMSDLSYNAPVTSYSWSAGSANVVSPTSSVTAINFTNPGTSIVTLTVSNGQGSSVKTRTVTVINSVAGVPNNYAESFETVGLPNGWSVINPNDGTVSWEQTSVASSHGSNSFFIEGLATFANNKEYLNMPIIDALNNSGNVLNFKFAYARFAATTNDILEVQGSMDCGGTWQTIVSLGASYMASSSAGILASEFIPTSGQWSLYNISDHPNWFNYTASSSVMIRFMFQSDFGGSGPTNRIYIDEINFGDPNGINELTKSIGLSLYPNPTNNSSVLKFNLNDAARVGLNITDISGRELVKEKTMELGAGKHEWMVNESNTLSKGVYFVNISLNGAKMCKKLIVE